MSLWKVEIDDDFIDLIELMDVEQQKVIAALQNILIASGPDGIGVRSSELEGVPSWESLGSVVSVPARQQIAGQIRTIFLEIYPDFKVVIVRLE